MLFGTDSTLTAPWDMWAHLRAARAHGGLGDEALFGAVTADAADVWGLADRGRLAPGLRADLVVAHAPEAGWDAFYGVSPSRLLLVVRGGRVLLADPSLALGPLDPGDLAPAVVDGAEKRVAAGLAGVPERT